MTAVHDRPAQQSGKITVEEFEELSAGAPEHVSLEFLFERVGVKAVPDGDHGSIIVWLIRQCMQSRPGLDVYPDQGLKVETYRSGRARPDAVVVPRRHFAGQSEWASPEGVLMAVEVTSFDDDTDQRDRVEKPKAYAESAIPLYLLIDRDANELTVHFEPVDGKYSKTHMVPFGTSLTIPEPLGITLTTDELLDYIR